MKRLKRIFTGTLPLFLLLWAGMMGVLWGLTKEKHAADILSVVLSTRDLTRRYYQDIWVNEDPEDQTPASLSNWLGNPLYNYDGVIQFRFYTSDGQELARSQMTKCTAVLPGPGTHMWFLWLDAVLSQEEQLELAARLRAEPELNNFLGSVSGRVTEEETDARWCDVVGVVDEEQKVLCPKTITYVYADREVTLVDTDSSFFDGKELTSMRFESLSLSSALVGRSASPQELLRLWEKIETWHDWHSLHGNLRVEMESSDGTASIPLADGTTMVCTYSYAPIYRIIRELKFTALLTLLAAVAIALFTDYRQRKALQRERDFARAAAHELKTPLAVLRAHAEALQEDIAPEKRAQYLDVVLSESDRMTTLVGRLLALSRPEAKRKPNKTPVELTPLVQEVFAPLSLPLEQKNLQLQLELEEVSLRGDPAQLREAVENLASNALRHATPGGTIQVTLEATGSRARLTIYNDGPNIPEKDLPRLWEPFYRADPSRSRDSGGTGLGLALVRKAVEAHNGHCWAENRPGGVAFVLEFPM